VGYGIYWLVFGWQCVGGHDGTVLLLRALLKDYVLAYCPRYARYVLLVDTKETFSLSDFYTSTINLPSPEFKALRWRAPILYKALPISTHC
jgi:hypothetical protein